MTLSRRRLVVALAPLAGAAAACAAPPDQTGRPLRGGATAITYWKSLTGPRHDAQVRLVDAYNAAQDRVRVTLEHAGEYNPAAEKLRVALASGSGLPDAMMLSTNSDMPFFARRGTLEPLDGLARRDPAKPLDGFYPRLLDDGRVGGALYQLPFARSTPLLYLNLDLLRAAGVPESAPSTWEDLVSVSRQIARSRPVGGESLAAANGDETSGLATPPAPLPFGVTTSWYELQSLLWSFGGAYSGAANGPGRPAVRIDSPASVAAMQFVADLVHRHRVATATKAAMIEFNQGQRAFFSGTTASLTQILDTKLFHAGAGLIPGRAGGPYAIPGGGAGLSILAPMPPASREAAWDFLTFMTSTPNTAQFAEATGYTPVRPAALSTPEMQRLLGRYPAAKLAMDQLSSVRPVDAVLGEPFAGLRIEAALQRILFDHADVRQTCQELAAELKQER